MFGECALTDPRGAGLTAVGGYRAAGLAEPGAVAVAAMPASTSMPVTREAERRELPACVIRPVLTRERAARLQSRAARDRGGTSCLRSQAPLALLPYRRRNFSTRPAVSRTRACPV